MIIHFISPSWRNLAKIWMTTVVCGFFFVLLKFLFFPRVSSYRLTDRTHKGRGQAPTLSDPPLSNTSFCLLPRAYKFAQGPHPMWFPTLLKHPFFAPPPPRTGVRSNLLQIWRCGIQIIHFMANWVFCEFWFEFQGREKGLGGKGGWCANNPSGECKFAPNHSSGVRCKIFITALCFVLLPILLRDWIYKKYSFFALAALYPKYLLVDEFYNLWIMTRELSDTGDTNIFNLCNVHISTTVNSVWGSHTMRTLSTAAQTWDITPSQLQKKQAILPSANICHMNTCNLEIEFWVKVSNTTFVQRKDETGAQGRTPCLVCGF